MAHVVAMLQVALCMHNIAFQGRFFRDTWNELGLPASSLRKFEFEDGYPKVFDESSPADDKAAQVGSTGVHAWALMSGHPLVSGEPQGRALPCEQLATVPPAGKSVAWGLGRPACTEVRDAGWMGIGWCM